MSILIILHESPTKKTILPFRRLIRNISLRSISHQCKLVIVIYLEISSKSPLYPHPLQARQVMILLGTLCIQWSGKTVLTTRTVTDSNPCYGTSPKGFPSSVMRNFSQLVKMTLTNLKGPF